MESSRSAAKDGDIRFFTGPSNYASNKFMVANIPEEYLKPGMPRYVLTTNPHSNEKVTADFPAEKLLRAMFPRSPGKQSNDLKCSNSELNSNTERIEDSRKMQSDWIAEENAVSQSAAHPTLPNQSHSEPIPVLVQPHAASYALREQPYQLPQQLLFGEPPPMPHSPLFKPPHEFSHSSLLGEPPQMPSPLLFEQSHASLREQPHGTSHPALLGQSHEALLFEQPYGTSHQPFLRQPNESSRAKPVMQNRSRITFPTAPQPNFNEESNFPVWINENLVFQNSPQVTQPIGAPQFSYNANNQNHVPLFQPRSNFNPNYHQRGHQRLFQVPRFEQNQNYNNRSGNRRPYRNSFRGRNRADRGRNNNRNWPQQEYHNYKQ